ncbi:MAG: type III secretion system translocon subunit SctB [Polaromonas sp.]|nr:type III secretion system translocon subunit SctB [Polaromonas sp.]
MAAVGDNQAYVSPYNPVHTGGTSSTGGTSAPGNSGHVLDKDTTLGSISTGFNKEDFADLPAPLVNYAASIMSGANAMASYGDTDMQGDMMAFMALFQQIAQTLRTSVREGRNAETAAQVTSLNAAGDKIIAAAELRYNAAQIQADYAIAASAVSIGISVVQIGVAGAGLAKSMSGAKTSSMGESAKFEAQSQTGVNAKGSAGRVQQANTIIADGAKLTAQGNAITAGSQALNGIGQGVSGIIKAAGDKLAAEEEKKASAQDAAGTKDQADAKMHEAAAQNYADTAQAMQDIIRDMREKTGAMEQATVDTNKAIARNV